MGYILWEKLGALFPLPRMKVALRSLFARNVRALRKARRLSQEDLAGATQIDRSYISNIENAHYSISIDQIEKLASAFGVEVYELFHPDTAERIDNGTI